MFSLASFQDWYLGKLQALTATTKLSGYTDNLKGFYSAIQETCCPTILP